jgi:FkbM family methyltransferase
MKILPKIKETIRTARWIMAPKSMAKRCLGKARQFEPEADLLDRLILKDKAFVDIGANWGFWSLLAEEYASQDQIFSVEPTSIPYWRLCKWKPNQSYKIALSDKPGSALISSPIIDGETRDTRSTLETGFAETGETGRISERVQVSTLDDFAKKECKRPIGFIKIDVEGHELQVLKGGTNTIAEQRPNLLVEIETRHHEGQINHIIEFILKYGYVGEFLDPQSKSLRCVSEFNPLIHQSESQEIYIQNFIFSRNGLDAV